MASCVVSVCVRMSGASCTVACKCVRCASEWASSAHKAYGSAGQKCVLFAPAASGQKPMGHSDALLPAASASACTWRAKQQLSAFCSHAQPSRARRAVGSSRVCLWPLAFGLLAAWLAHLLGARAPLRSRTSEHRTNLGRVEQQTRLGSPNLQNTFKSSLGQSTTPSTSQLESAPKLESISNLNALLASQPASHSLTYSNHEDGKDEPKGPREEEQ